MVIDSETSSKQLCLRNETYIGKAVSDWTCNGSEKDGRSITDIIYYNR